MMLLKIECTCGHMVSAESLPRELQCSRCGSSRHVEAKAGELFV
jgi:hypothetical protein